MSDPLADARIRSYIEELVGPEGMRITEALMSKPEATDSQLAEELGAKPSHIRKVLYDLYEARIAEYHKEKDKETGWLTFYWKIQPQAATNAFNDTMRKRLVELERRLSFERDNEFFSCPVGQERFDFANATEHDFHCPEHGEILQAQDNTVDIEELQARISEIRDASAQRKDQA